MERENCGVLVFFTDSLNSECADIAGTDSSQGNPTRPRPRLGIHAGGTDSTK